MGCQLFTAAAQDRHGGERVPQRAAPSRGRRSAPRKQYSYASISRKFARPRDHRRHPLELESAQNGVDDVNYSMMDVLMSAPQLNRPSPPPSVFSVKSFDARDGNSEMPSVTITPLHAAQLTAVERAVAAINDGTGAPALSLAGEDRMSHTDSLDSRSLRSIPTPPPTCATRKASQRSTDAISAATTPPTQAACPLYKDNSFGSASAASHESKRDGSNAVNRVGGSADGHKGRRADRFVPLPAAPLDRAKERGGTAASYALSPLLSRSVSPQTWTGNGFAGPPFDLPLVPGTASHVLDARSRSRGECITRLSGTNDVSRRAESPSQFLTQASAGTAPPLSPSFLSMENAMQNVVSAFMKDDGDAAGYRGQSPRLTISDDNMMNDFGNFSNSRIAWQQFSGTPAAATPTSPQTGRPDSSQRLLPSFSPIHTRGSSSHGNKAAGLLAGRSGAGAETPSRVVGGLWGIGSAPVTPPLSSTHLRGTANHPSDAAAAAEGQVDAATAARVLLPSPSAHSASATAASTARQGRNDQGAAPLSRVPVSLRMLPPSPSSSPTSPVLLSTPTGDFTWSSSSSSDASSCLGGDGSSADGGEASAAQSDESGRKAARWRKLPLMPRPSCQGGINRFTRTSAGQTATPSAVTVVAAQTAAGWTQTAPPHRGRAASLSPISLINGDGACEQEVGGGATREATGELRRQAVFTCGPPPRVSAEAFPRMSQAQDVSAMRTQSRRVCDTPAAAAHSGAVSLITRPVRSALQPSMYSRARQHGRPRAATLWYDPYTEPVEAEAPPQPSPRSSGSEASGDKDQERGPGTAICGTKGARANEEAAGLSGNGKIDLLAPVKGHPGVQPSAAATQRPMNGPGRCVGDTILKHKVTANKRKKKKYPRSSLRTLESNLEEEEEGNRVRRQGRRFSLASLVLSNNSTSYASSTSGDTSSVSSGDACVRGRGRVIFFESLPEK